MLFMRFFRTLSMAAALMLAGSSVTFASGEIGLGDQGTEIAEIQGSLVQLGYDVVADGDFGPATVDAVKSFQEQQGITANGMVDSMTYRSLLGREMPEIAHGTNYINRKIVSTSMEYIGVPYVFGGNNPRTGLDCSAYVKLVFSRVGINLPRTADAQFERGTPVAITELVPGDAVFFQTYTAGASHVGIYIGEGNFIHASSSRGVTISSLGSSYYSTHYIGARRMTN